MAATRQEIFDKLVCDMVVQGRPSFLVDAAGVNHCAYRGMDGAKCAIGMLIPSEMYTINMENMSVDTLVEVFPEVKSILAFNILGMELLVDIQYSHDYRLEEDFKYFVDNFLLSMRIVAREHGLEWHFKEV